MKPSNLKIAVLQLDFSVGKPMLNKQVLLDGYGRAVKDGASLVLAPELATSGYPPKDDLLHRGFVRACMRVAEEVAMAVGDVPLAFGTPWLADQPGDYGQLCHNSYVVAHKGRLVFRTDKRYPAQGGVFDEYRVHVPGTPKVFEHDGLRIGFPICEDIWHDAVVAGLAAQHVDVMLVPNGSPTYAGKPRVRHMLVADHVEKHGIPMLYLNHVGGQDEHAFDGDAFYVNPGSREAVVFTPYWQEAVAMIDLLRPANGCSFSLPAGVAAQPEPDADQYILDGVVVTTRDYIRKSSSLQKVVIGISGGVDSAVVLGIAKLAVGAENIIAVSMPTRHNSDTTKGFAQQVCDRMGVPLIWYPIGEAVDAAVKQYTDVMGHAPDGLAGENLQSRERGKVLMTISNREGAMLLSTGNKSEMAMGYATLYGDMNGGFNPLKTLYKTQVFQLARTINARLGGEAIPEKLITQAPSAELKDGQADQDSLPPYPVLDAILVRFLDQKRDVAEIVGGPSAWFGNAEASFPERHDPRWEDGLAERAPMQRWMAYGEPLYAVHPDCVEAVIRQVLRVRFKRYQACPGVTMTTGSFDDGENYPIANGDAWVTEGLPLLTRAA